MKTRKLKEDGAAAAPAPTMSAGSGQIAGIGVGPQGEPGVNMNIRKKKWKQEKQKSVRRVPREMISGGVVSESFKPMNPELWAAAQIMAHAEYPQHPTPDSTKYAIRWYVKNGGEYDSNVAKNESALEEVSAPTPCWKGYEMIGMKMKDGQRVPNCVPKNESAESNTPADREWGSDSLVKIYKRDTPGESLKEMSTLYALHDLAEAWEKITKCQQCGATLSPREQKLGFRICDKCVSKNKGKVWGKDSDDDYMDEDCGCGDDDPKTYKENDVRWFDSYTEQRRSTGQTLSECIIVNQKLNGVQVVAKNRDRAYKPTIEVVHEILDGTEVAYLHDVDTDWSEGVNEFGIAIVNTALDTDFDEDEGDKDKQITNRDKIRKDAHVKGHDGEIIRKALAQKTQKEAVNVITTYKGGLAGHTIVATTKNVVTIEYGTELKSQIKPYIENHKPDELIVRTNHGLHYTHIGYTRHNDEKGYESSVERKVNAEAVLRDVKDWHQVLPALRHQMFKHDSPLNLVRATEGMWTTSQTLVNLSSLMLEIDYFKDKIEKMLGVKTKLPAGYKPKISITTKDVAITNGDEPESVKESRRLHEAQASRVVVDYLYGKPGGSASQTRTVIATSNLARPQSRSELAVLAYLRKKHPGADIVLIDVDYQDSTGKSLMEETEYQGKKVTLNKPFRSSDGKHKFYVYVKNDKNNVIKLGFGDPNMEIKRDDPDRRKAYRDRHNCDNPGPKWKAEYWSCRMWSAKPVSKIAEATNAYWKPTPKEITGFLKARDAERRSPMNGITHNDTYNLRTFGITQTAYSTIAARASEKYGPSFWKAQIKTAKDIAKLFGGTDTTPKCIECGRPLTAREKKYNFSGVCDACNLAHRNRHDRARTFDESIIVTEATSLDQQVTDLLSSKDVPPTTERQIQRMLQRRDATELKKVLVWLKKQPDAPNKKDYAKFERLWEKVPSYWHGYAKPGEGVQASLARFHQETTEYFRKHFGGPSIWTDDLLRRYTSAARLEPPKITYKGKTHSLKTGWDQKEFVWHVIQDNHATSKLRESVKLSEAKAEIIAVPKNPREGDGKGYWRIGNDVYRGPVKDVVLDVWGMPQDKRWESSLDHFARYWNGLYAAHYVKTKAWQ